VIDLVKQAEKNIRSRRLIRPGQAVLLAVSGGVDSMVLLDAMARLAPARGWKLSVAHLNHQLRGRSSDADERLVRKAARRHKLPCFLERADVRELARREKISLEMAARKARHEFLARIAIKQKIPSVVLAHHANDQVELFFLRLFRGSGSEGLAGMKWRNASPANSRIHLVRPFLDLPRVALADYARTHRIEFREDATNRALDFQRNRIRHKLLPLLEKEFQPALATTISRVAEIVGAESAWIDEVASQWLARHIHKKNTSAKPRSLPALNAAFEKLPVSLQRRCIYLQLLQHGAAANYSLVEQLRREPGQRVNLSQSGSADQLTAYVERDAKGKLQFGSRPPDRPLFTPSLAKVDLRGSRECVLKGTKVWWSIAGHRAGALPTWRDRRENFDADKVGPRIILRHWRPGDRFQPIGMSSAIKLQDVFVNQKVPKARRHQLWLGTTPGGEIFWVEGLRISERFKLSEGTKRRLIWQWQPS
jgi:tRNA(Ile)-lysidine synthase